MSYDNALCSLRGEEYRRFINFAAAVSDKYGYDTEGEPRAHIVGELDETALDYLRSAESVLDICADNGGVCNLCFYDVEKWCEVDTSAERAYVAPEYWEVYVEKFAGEDIGKLLSYDYSGSR